MGKLIGQPDKASVFIDTKSLYDMAMKVLHDLHFKVHSHSAKEAVPDMIAVVKEKLLLVESKIPEEEIPLLEAAKRLKKKNPEMDILIVSDRARSLQYDLAIYEKCMDFIPRMGLTESQLRERIQVHLQKKFHKESIRASRSEELLPVFWGVGLHLEASMEKILKWVRTPANLRVIIFGVVGILYLLSRSDGLLGRQLREHSQILFPTWGGNVNR